MDTWPTTLPQQLSADTTIQDNESRAIQDMDSGPASVRNRFTAITKSVKGSMTLTGAELAIFNTFFRTTLKHGSLSFLWTDPQTDAAVTIRFSKKPAWSCVAPSSDPNQRQWTATMELEIQP